MVNPPSPLLRVSYPRSVLLDIGLPKLNGYEVAQRIRESAWGQSMFLIAVTGWGQEEDRQRSSEVGLNVHMVKPVEPAALERLRCPSFVAERCKTG